MLDSRERTDEKPTTATEDPGTGPDRPRLRWIAEGRVEQVDIGPGGAPRLISTGRRGGSAQLASLVLEALDRAAAGAERVRVSREGWELFVDRPGGWRLPGRPVSAILGEGAERDPRRLPGQGGHEARRWAELRRRARELSDDDRELLAGYREQRRVLAARQRRLERQILRQSDSLRLHQRVARVWGLAAAGGLIATVAGIAAGPIWLLAAGAGGFCLGAGGLAVERLSLPGGRAVQEDLERRLARVIAATDELETRARRAAEQMGADGPWEATERIDALQVTPLSEEAAARVRERFRALAGRLGVEAETDPDPTVPGGSGEGWPIEVAARVEGLDSDGPELSARLAAAARLIDRIERHLPEPWPVVFWEPWSDLPADRQAAWLLAVSEEIAPRPLLAVVRAQRA